MTRTMCSGGLEPHFGVLLSAIFQGVSLGNFHQRGKQWKVVEAKLLQTAANLRTFFVLVISAGALKSFVASKFFVPCGISRAIAP